jgi:cobalt-zinc-cadmium efflux system membrane fusion protein
MKGYVGVGIGALLGAVVTFSLDALVGEDKETMASANAAAVTPPNDVKISEELVSRAKLTSELVTKRALAPTLDLVGSVNFDPDAVADVGGRIAGRITRVMVTVGDAVTSGRPLVELESNSLGDALAELLSERANLIAAENRAQRESALAEKQLSSATVVEAARAEAKALQAEVKGAEQRLLTMGITPGEIKNLHAGDGPRLVTLRAPIAGEVVERYAVLGQVVDPTEPIMRIANLSTLWVELDVYERDLAHVAVGDEAEIRSETYPDKIFHGTVSYVNATIDVATRTARVRVEVPNPDRQLRPGQFVHARLSTRGITEPIVAIPRKAVLQVEGEPSVFVQVDKTHYTARPVELGRVAGDLVEIKRGLLEGERVVIEGGFVLKSELLR